MIKTKLIKPFFLLFALLILGAQGFASCNGIYRVSSLDYDSPDREFKFIDKVIKDARIVGLGESAHGSSQFLEARGRLTKYLVEKHDYRLILLEDAYAKTEGVNNYLKKCSEGRAFPDGANKALQSLDFLYRSIETQKLLAWLCKFNQTAKTPVSFHGIDQWEDPWVQRDLIKKGVERFSSPVFNDLYEKAVNNCYAWKVNSWKEAEKKGLFKYILETWRLDPAKHRVCIGTLYNLQRFVSKQPANENSEELFWIKKSLKVSYVYQMYRDLYITDTPRALNLRDDLQAYLVKSWMDYYSNSKKAVLMEHNVHISRKQSDIIPSEPGDLFKWVGVRSTGENLIATYDIGYKSIGITGYDIASSRDGQYKKLDKENSLDYKLAQKGELLIVNPKARWIRSKKSWWMHNENQPMYLRPDEQYDAIFFVKKSQAAKTLEEESENIE